MQFAFALFEDRAQEENMKAKGEKKNRFATVIKSCFKIVYSCANKRIVRAIATNRGEKKLFTVSNELLL